MKVIELFAGIGGVHSALKSNYDHVELVDAVESNPTVMKMYNILHRTDFEPQDIMEWNKDVKCDYLHASPPCQTFSKAGSYTGADDEKRGAPLWRKTLEIIEKTEPKIVTIENVKGLIEAKHKPLLEWFVSSLKNLGYSVGYSLKNSADFGSAQHRERVYIVGIRNHFYLHDFWSCVEEFKEDFFNYDNSTAKMLGSGKLGILKEHKFPFKNAIELPNGNYLIPNELSSHNGKVIEVELNRLINETYPGHLRRVGVIHQYKWNEITPELIANWKPNPIFNNSCRFYGVNGLQATVTNTNGPMSNKLMRFDGINIRYTTGTAYLATLWMGYKPEVYTELSKWFTDAQIYAAMGNSLEQNLCRAICHGVVMAYLCWR